ncbi:MAG: hypothetical protein IIC46_07145 [Planctomycetes bacterium]|nr:hypothetical protein [Planctomycetota bacterium]
MAVTGSSVFEGSYLPMMAMVAIVGIGVLLMISVRSKIARRNADRPSPRELIEQLKATSRHRGDAQSASAELMESARVLAAKLDNKAARLEVLIQQADERISLMSQLSGTGAVAQDGPPRTEAAELDRARTPVAANGPPVSLDPLTQSVYELADTGYQPIQIAQELQEQVGKVELILSLRDR